MSSKRTSSSKNTAKAETAAPRMATYFVPGAGIDREVISADICRYLGNDALVRPGVYTVSVLSEFYKQVRYITLC